MDVREAETKAKVLSELLEQGMVLVTLDARVEGVDVPRHLRDDAQLRLNLSYRFGLPMEVDAAGVTATLTFAGSPYKCVLPWRSIYLLVSHVSGRPILFPADVPAEFFPTGAEAPHITDLPIATPSRSRAAARPRLTVVPGESAEEPVEATVAPEALLDAPKERSRRSHLRVVK